jgi:hypothetical protein
MESENPVEDLLLAKENRKLLDNGIQGRDEDEYLYKKRLHEGFQGLKSCKNECY